MPPNPEFNINSPEGKPIKQVSDRVWPPMPEVANEAYHDEQESLDLVNQKLKELRRKDLELQTLFNEKNNEDIINPDDETYQKNLLKKEEELKILVGQMDNIIDEGRLLKVEKMYLEGKLKNKSADKPADKSADLEASA